MRLQIVLLFAGAACAALMVSRVYSEPTTVPTAQTSQPTPSPTSQARVDIDSTVAEIQAPADNNTSGNGLGFYGGSSANNAAAQTATPSGTASPQVTPALQNTVTAILSNPGLKGKDELAPSSSSKTNPSELVPTNLVLEPTETPIPSLQDKY